MTDDLTIICPATGRRISTPIKTDATTLKNEWRSDVIVRCPHCGDEHHMTVGEVYVESVLAHRL
jgi:RNase P subunit RPR2